MIGLSQCSNVASVLASPLRHASTGNTLLEIWYYESGASQWGSSELRWFLQSEHQLATTPDAGVWGKVPTHTVRAACWLPSGHLLTGAEDGAVVTWHKCRAVAKVHAHERGNPTRRPDGTPTFHGVRVILLHRDGKCVPLVQPQA